MTLQIQKPGTLEEWKPVFRRALLEYVLEQEGSITIINCRNLLKFISSRKGYPAIDTEEEANRVSKLLNCFFADLFGITWFGLKYRKMQSKGKSLLLGTDNILDIIRYEGKL